MAHIKCIKFLDNESHEAIIEITSGEISITAFSCPFNPNRNNCSVTLYAFMAEHIVREESLQPPVKTNSGIFSYHLTTKVIDSSACLVRLGTIDIILSSPLPNDIPNGAYVSFDVQRLDY